MFDALLPFLTLFLLANLAAGLWRIWRGPTDADRLLTALLFGTTSVAVLLLLSAWQSMPDIRTVALILVLLATILSISFFGMPAHHDD